MIESQIARFRQVLGNEVGPGQLPSHVARSCFQVEQAVLEAAVKASAYYSESLHHFSELSDRIKQLEYELGGEKAQVAELEDKIAGNEELCARVGMMEKEISFLKGEMSGLVDKAKAAETAVERRAKEASIFRERLKEGHAHIEALEAALAKAKRGEDLDYDLVVQSPHFTPYFEVLKGMVRESMRTIIAATYPDLDLSLLDAALNAKPQEKVVPPSPDH